MCTFHQNQIDTSDEIIRLITLGQCFCMILLAQMQSGKTGTYLRTAFRTIELDYHDQVIIISGSRDKKLRDQANKDLEREIESYCNTDEIEDEVKKVIAMSEKFRTFPDVILEIQNMNTKIVAKKELKEKLKSNISVAFGQDLKKIESVKDNTLIIHDESHAAQSKNNKPYEDFYKKHNIERSLYGDMSQISDRNIHILNVSATPMSELVSNEKVKMNLYDDDEDKYLQEHEVSLDEKEIIFANAGDGYRGVNYFLENGKIFFEAESIKVGSSEHIEKVLTEKKDTIYKDKYCIVRTHTANELMMESIADKCGYDYVSILGKDSIDAFKILETAPTHNTIIHISGRCRMGQVLCKTHIGMVYEQANDPKTDTILQGLLGRMCGYVGDKVTDYKQDSEMPEIYISKKAKSDILKYAKSWKDKDLKQFNKIKKANNVKGSNKHTNGDLVMDKSNVSWIKIVPIEFTIRDVNNISDALVNWDNIESNDVFNLLDDDRKKLISNNPDKNEILKFIESGRKIHTRNICKTTYIERDVLGKMEKASRENRRFVDQFSNNITDHVTEDVCSLQIIGSDANKDNIDGKIFVIGFVNYDSKIHGSMSIRLPKINPKCNHSIIVQEDSSVVEDFNGGQMIKFPFKKTSDDINEFEKELEKSIRRTIPESPTYIENCSRSINSMYCNESKEYKGIYSKAKMSELRKIEKKLNKKYPSINLKFNNKIVTDKPGYTRFPSITW